MEELPYRKTFLILEDDANDAFMIRRAFTNAACRAFVCRNTSEARAYLLGAGMYGDRERFPFPEIFVTDLHLGDESGANFLAWVRAKTEFKDLPVIVLSGSATPSELTAIKSLGVARVLQKPGDPSSLQSMLLSLASQVCFRSTHPGEKPWKSVLTSVGA